MAFTGLGADPCSILDIKTLSSASTPPVTQALWLSASVVSTTAYDDATDGLYFKQIASAGLTRTFLQVYSDSTFGASPILNTTANAETTNYPVRNFMKNKVMRDIVLGSSAPTPILSTTPSTSEYSTTFGDAAAFTALRSFLLTQAEIYSTTTPGNTLVGIYNAEQSGTASADQLATKTTLEDKNKKFFAAFLAEYCFYRTRYQWLVQKFFKVYSIPASTSTQANKYVSMSIPAASGLEALFAGAGTSINQYTLDANNKLPQEEYLKGIAFHLATLSKRLENMRAILIRVNAYYDEILQNIQRDINALNAPGSNTQLQTSLNALRSSAEESKKALSQRQFMEAAMQYTSEKNRYANILLGLYAFLNIAALAMIFKLK